MYNIEFFEYVDEQGNKKSFGITETECSTIKQAHTIAKNSIANFYEANGYRGNVLRTFEIVDTSNGNYIPKCAVCTTICYNPELVDTTSSIRPLHLCLQCWNDYELAMGHTCDYCGNYAYVNSEDSSMVKDTSNALLCSNCKDNTPIDTQVVIDCLPVVTSKSHITNEAYCYEANIVKNGVSIGTLAKSNNYTRIEKFAARVIRNIGVNAHLWNDTYQFTISHL